MKKALAILALVILSLLLVVSCGGNKGENTDTPNEPTEPTEPTEYTITWIDENGSTISTSTVAEGTVPSINYTVTDTQEWDYTFEGWATDAGGEALTSIPAADKNTSYYAIVSAVKQKYTVTFVTGDGSTVDEQVVEYGQKAQKPQDPTCDGYKFMGWCYDEDGTSVVDFESAITGELSIYAIWNEIIDAKTLLSALLNGYDLNPFEMIPESMRGDFSENLVDASELVTDYSSFVNISSIEYGFGEQWQMILDNIEQSQTFFNILTVVDGLSAASISAFNNYFDKNPSDTAHHQLANGIYNITINFDGKIIAYIVDYTATIPVFGEQTVQIALTMDAETGERTARIQAGDANALKYTLVDGKYEFAIKYLGVRRAMFSLTTHEDGTASGHIYEYLTALDKEFESAADFYINEDYVSVVGNKADGIIGFTNTICELYSTESGKMIGYEVQETKSALVFNTIWFNLCDIDGINSLKYIEAGEKTPAEIYINGSSSVWESMKVGSGLKMLSRRFDIEYRTQYVYSYDSASGDYTAHKIQVPMIFIQEENYDTFVADVKTKNKVNISVDVESDSFEILLASYDSFIPAFISNKDNMTAQVILDYIGNVLVIE